MVCKFLSVMMDFFSCEMKFDGIGNVLANPVESFRPFHQNFYFT